MMLQQTYPFSLLPLPYPYSACEPYIDSDTMYLHHTKHLKSYINNLNTILEKEPELQQDTIEQLLLKIPILPDYLKEGILRNAGGVYNHVLYFQCIGKSRTDPNPSKQEETLPIIKEINKQFGTFNQFKKDITNSAVNQFGSGYTWLVLTDRNSLVIVNTDNQTPIILFDLKPILLIDMWEHAYYLKCQNRKEEYCNNWFHTLNWDFINIIYHQISQ